MPGRLFICATPIGNLADVSRRLAETLASVEVVYAEDTRRTAKLLAALGITAELRSYFQGNERQRAVQLGNDLAAGREVAVVSDAGSPAVSDPGAAAISAARKADAEVIVVPGPSAVTAAVSVSGMVRGPFTFEGFLARKGRERSEQLRGVADETRPSVLFLSPHRVADDLADLAEACGEGRAVCVARELTKLHEEVWWGTLGAAARRWSEVPARGEFTVVVEAGSGRQVTVAEAVELARDLLEGGRSPSEAAREAASATGVSRRAIYDGLVR